MPVPGTTTPEPSPLVHVTAHASPSPSSTETCVVEPELRREEALGEARLARPAANSGVRVGLRSAIASTSSAARRRGRRVEPRRARSASRIPPADGGGLVSTSRPR